jgi:hypothetical protein
MNVATDVISYDDVNANADGNPAYSGAQEEFWQGAREVHFRANAPFRLLVQI